MFQSLILQKTIRIARCLMFVLSTTGSTTFLFGSSRTQWLTTRWEKYFLIFLHEFNFFYLIDKSDDNQWRRCWPRPGGCWGWGQPWCWGSYDGDQTEEEHCRYAEGERHEEQDQDREKFPQRLPISCDRATLSFHLGIWYGIIPIKYIIDNQ